MRLERRLIQLLFSLVFIGLGFSTRALAISDDDLFRFSQSRTWQRLYFYENGKSAVVTPEFFFSHQGATDALAELKAAIAAYSDPSILVGREHIPAACAFPARLKRLESLGLKFKHVDCPTLQQWLGDFTGSRLSLAFAGAYAGNPASIMGHTFLRFGDQPARDTERERLNTVSVGFLAHTDPRDSHMTYALKGMLGLYLGRFELEPQYMKVGLYNNSESRDLWEQSVRFDANEVQFVKYLLWELINNGEIPYYFVTKNCSYRILNLIEAAKPEWDLTANLSAVVLPPESVRLMNDQYQVEPTVRFSPSIRRQLRARLAQLPPNLRRQFWRARKHASDLSQVRDARVLDALIDDWTFRNYDKSANLPQADRDLMNATLKMRASFKAPSAPLELEQIDPPFLGHRRHWVSFSGGASSGEAYENFSYRSGIHSPELNGRGFENSSQLEFLGFDISHFEKPYSVGSSSWHYNALLIHAEALPEFSRLDHNLSWSFRLGVNNSLFLSELPNFNLYLGGGGGFAFILADQVRAFVMLDGIAGEYNEPSRAPFLQSYFAPGVTVGLRANLGSQYIGLLEAVSHVSSNFNEPFFGYTREILARAYFGRALSLNSVLALKFEEQWVRPLSLSGQIASAAYTINW